MSASVCTGVPILMARISSPRTSPPRGVLIGATLVTPRGGEILGELILAVKIGTPVQTLADTIHPYPAFNRVLGTALGELAAKVA